MGYDGPSDYSSTLARISTWSSAAGMQTFLGAGPDTLLLGGEVLVLDVGLVPEPTVHASYAGSATEGRQCLAMDAFFSRLVSGVSKGGDGWRLRDALEYLMRLDKLAMREGNAGPRWFGEVEALAKELTKYTQEEVALLAQCVTFHPFHLWYHPFCLWEFQGGLWGGISSRYVRANERTNTKLAGLRDNPRFLSMSSCSVDTRWGFHTSIPRHSASWSISLHEPIYLSNAALRCLRSRSFPPLTFRPLTFITASTQISHCPGSPVQLSPSCRFPRRHLPLQTHCYLLSLHFRSPLQRSGLPTTFHCRRALTPGSMVGCLLSGKVSL